MAIVRQAIFDSTTSSTNVSSVSCTGLAAGDTLLFLARWDSSNTANNVASIVVGSTTATLVGSDYGPFTPGNARHQWGIISNSTETGTQTCTLTMDFNCTKRITCWRLTGCDTSGAFDAFASANGASGNPTLTLTTGVSGAAIFAAWTDGASDTTNEVAGTGYTLEPLNNANWYDSAEYNLNVGSAGSKTVDCTRNSGAWIMTAVSLKSSFTQSQAPRSMQQYRLRRV